MWAVVAGSPVPLDGGPVCGVFRKRGVRKSGFRATMSPATALTLATSAGVGFGVGLWAHAIPSSEQRCFPGRKLATHWEVL